MISVQRPEMLFLLIIIPLIVIIHLVTVTFFSKKVFKFANYETLKRLNDGKRVFSRRLPELVIRILFVTIVILAAAGLTYSYKTTGFKNEVIIAVDSSGSMLTKDISQQTTRLDAAKSAVSIFASNLSSGMKLGIISFTSTANVVQEPTYDLMQLSSSIEEIKVSTSRGTSIGEAISYASAVFRHDSVKEKQLIIITDGQENVLSSEELVEVLNEAKRDNINVDVIGIGTATGASITEEMTGTLVLNEKSVEEIAKEAGGKYIFALNDDDVVTALRSLTEKGPVTRDYDLTLILFMVGFVILIIEWYLANYLFRSFP